MQGEIGGAEGVDGMLRAACGVGALAVEGDDLHAEAIVVRRAVSAAAQMVHDGHVDIVENAFQNQGGFTAQRLDFAFFNKFVAPFDFDAFLRRAGDECDLAGDVVLGVGLDEADGRAEHGGDMRIVSAGVGGSRGGIAFGMRRNDQRIHFAADGERRAGLDAVQIRTHACDGEVAFGREADVRQRLGGEIGGLELLVAGLRILPDGRPDVDDFITVGVDCRQNVFDELLFGSHGENLRVRVLD